MNKFLQKSFYTQTLKSSVSEALSIPPEVYFSKDFFTLEQERIFDKFWIPVGFTQEFDSQFNILPMQLGQRSVIVSKDKTGSFSGFLNLCRHRAAQLVNKPMKGNAISCPYHRWLYSAQTGELKGTPMCKVNKQDFPLYDIGLKIRNNIIFAKMNKNENNENENNENENNENNENNDIDEYYGDALDVLNYYPLHSSKLVRTAEFHIKCNWKLLVDNFVEWYHLKAVHPALVKSSRITDHIDIQGIGKYIGFKTDPLTQSGLPIDYSIKPAFRGLPEDMKKVATFQCLYPTLIHFTLPNHSFMINIIPVSETTSLEKVYLFTDKNDDCDNKWYDDLMAFYSEVNQEDITICEAVQKGLVNGRAVYNGGVMIEGMESTIHRFHNMLIKDILNK